MTGIKDSILGGLMLQEPWLGKSWGPDWVTPRYTAAHATFSGRDDLLLSRHSCARNVSQHSAASGSSSEFSVLGRK